MIDKIQKEHFNIAEENLSVTIKHMGAFSEYVGRRYDMLSEDLWASKKDGNHDTYTTKELIQEYIKLL